jgi:hypothetical protein
MAFVAVPFAATNPGLKVESPKVLHSFISVGPDCELSEREVREVVDGVVVGRGLTTGVLSRSQLASGMDVGEQRFGLYVTLDCFAPGSGPCRPFSFNITFIRFVPGVGRFLHEQGTYGRFGAGGNALVLQNLEGAVQKAVTDYVLANVDALGVAVEGQPLVSFHGTVWTAYDVDPEVPMQDLPFVRSEVWARGDFTRYESSADSRKVIGIQRGPIMYSFVEGERTGIKVQLRGGIGTLGLVRQFELIRSAGKKVGADSVDGRLYDEYECQDPATGESISTRLSRETSIPDVWAGHLPSGNVTFVVYEDAQANVDIPDDAFSIPRDVEFAANPNLTSPSGSPDDD